MERKFKILRIQQGSSVHEFVLPEEQANTVMSIMKTNKYWCVDVTDSLDDDTYNKIIINKHK